MKAGSNLMRYRIVLAAAALAASAAVGNAQVVDYSKYPDLKGQWNRLIVPGVGGMPSFDQTKPWGFGQEAPLTDEYKAVLEASIADQARGGQGNFTGVACGAFGMPLMMEAFYPQEYIITPETTYILINNADHARRVFTDGRDWPKNLATPEPTYQGYSLGRWIDENHEGRYSVLEIETRGPFKGPRAYDGSGLPLAHDNQSIFKERIHLDRQDPNLLHDEFTVIDHALTRPWTVDKRYLRNPEAQPNWPEYVCAEHNVHVQVGKENYYISADGFLMPTRKDQSPPDARYFRRATSR